MITGSVTGQDGIRTRLQRTERGVHPAIERTIKKEALNLVSVVKRKLSDVLVKVRTGRLRRSINALFTSGNNTFQAAVGTNVKYARPLELGFNGTVNVPAHSVKAFKRLQSTAFGKPMKSPRIVDVRAHVVKAHSMKMNVRARRFLGSSLDENKPRIMGNLRKALAEALI